MYSSAPSWYPSHNQSGGNGYSTSQPSSGYHQYQQGAYQIQAPVSLPSPLNQNNYGSGGGGMDPYSYQNTPPPPSQGNYRHQYSGGSRGYGSGGQSSHSQHYQQQMPQSQYQYHQHYQTSSLASHHQQLQSQSSASSYGQPLTPPQQYGSKPSYGRGSDGGGKHQGTSQSYHHHQQNQYTQQGPSSSLAPTPLQPKALLPPLSSSTATSSGTGSLMIIPPSLSPSPAFGSSGISGVGEKLPTLPLLSSSSSTTVLPPLFELAMSPTMELDLQGYPSSDSTMPDDHIYAFRPALPPTAEEVSDQLLDKLEQAGRVPSKEKFRRMACNTFVFTGACPYNDRCVFLHDYRIKAEGMKVRTTRQTKANSTIKDTFYWPDMTRKEVIRNVDPQGLPTANQIYSVPETFKGNPSNFHNRGLYSLWAHFVEFCIQNANMLNRSKHRDICEESFFQISGYKENPHVPGAKRLDVLIRLSLGKIFVPVDYVLTPLGHAAKGMSFGKGVASSGIYPAVDVSLRKTWTEGALGGAVSSLSFLLYDECDDEEERMRRDRDLSTTPLLPHQKVSQKPPVHPPLAVSTASEKRRFSTSDISIGSSASTLTGGGLLILHPDSNSPSDSDDDGPLSFGYTNPRGIGGIGPVGLAGESDDITYTDKEIYRDPFSRRSSLQSSTLDLYDTNTGLSTLDSVSHPSNWGLSDESTAMKPMTMSFQTVQSLLPQTSLTSSANTLSAASAPTDDWLSVMESETLSRFPAVSSSSSLNAISNSNGNTEGLDLTFGAFGTPSTGSKEKDTAVGSGLVFGTGLRQSSSFPALTIDTDAIPTNDATASSVWDSSSSARGVGEKVIEEPVSYVVTDWLNGNSTSTASTTAWPTAVTTTSALSAPTDSGADYLLEGLTLDDEPDEPLVPSISLDELIEEASRNEEEGMVERDVEEDNYGMYPLEEGEIYEGLAGSDEDGLHKDMGDVLTFSGFGENEGEAHEDFFKASAITSSFWADSGLSSSTAVDSLEEDYARNECAMEVVKGSTDDFWSNLLGPGQSTGTDVFDVSDHETAN